LDNKAAALHHLIHLPGTSASGYLPGYILVYPGSPVILKNNVCVEDGIFNAAEGFFLSMETTETWDEDPALGVHFLKQLPKSLTVYFPNATVPAPIDLYETNPPIGVVVLTPHKATIHYSTKSHTHCRSSNANTVQINMLQYKLHHGRDKTDYGIQGKTELGLLISPPTVNTYKGVKQNSLVFHSIYVMLSRLKRHVGVFLTSPLTLETLKLILNPFLLQDLQRLKKLEKSTLRDWESKFLEAYPKYVCPSTDPYRYESPDFPKFLTLYSDLVQKDLSLWKRECTKHTKDLLDQLQTLHNSQRTKLRSLQCDS
jgi:hypothetical protein